MPDALKTVVYRSERQSDGTFTIFDVPVFGLVPEGAHGSNPEVDVSFLRGALKRDHERRTRDGYSAPLNVRHNGQDGAHRAATFALTRVGMDFEYQGVRQATLFANFFGLTEEIMREIAAGRLPYRSVEVDYRSGEVVAIALLDKDPPFFKYANLNVNTPDGVSAFSDRASDLFGFDEPFRCAFTNDPKPGDGPGDETGVFNMDKVLEELKKLNSRIDALEAGKSGASEDAPVEPFAAKPAETPEADEAEDPQTDKFDAGSAGEIAALRQEIDDMKATKAREDDLATTFAALKDEGYNLSDETRAQFAKAAETAGGLKIMADSFRSHARKEPVSSLDAIIGNEPTDSDEIAEFLKDGDPDKVAAAREADATFTELIEGGYQTPVTRGEFIAQQVLVATGGKE